MDSELTVSNYSLGLCGPESPWSDGEDFCVDKYCSAYLPQDSTVASGAALVGFTATLALLTCAVCCKVGVNRVWRRSCTQIICAGSGLDALKATNGSERQALGRAGFLMVVVLVAAFAVGIFVLAYANWCDGCVANNFGIWSIGRIEPCCIRFCQSPESHF